MPDLIWLSLRDRGGLRRLVTAQSAELRRAYLSSGSHPATRPPRNRSSGPDVWEVIRVIMETRNAEALLSPIEILELVSANGAVSPRHV